MSRWEPNAEGRLRLAAMELFVEQGYEKTTVADIADRAGLTARTFFRYFADKREVLFAGSEVMLQAVVAALEGAPSGASAMEAVGAALAAAAEVLGAHRDLSRRRQAVITANAELRERELIKLAMLASLLTEALRRRGVDDPEASLAAEAAVAVIRVAFERWVADDEERELSVVMSESLDRLRGLASR